jgi:hypothetical protein
MGKNSRPSFQKRAKEKVRQERQKEKAVRRTETKERRANAAPRSGDDPDIAGIIPGPQPQLPEFDSAQTRDEPSR